jgi:hypothetical protein
MKFIRETLQEGIEDVRQKAKTAVN